MLEARLAETLSQYQRDGIAVIRSVFTPSEMNTLRSAAFMALTELGDIGHNGYRGKALETVDTGQTKSPALVFWPALASAALDEFRTDPRLQTIVRALLGPDVKQLNNQIYFRLPGDTDSFAWHQDITDLTTDPRNLVNEQAFFLGGDREPVYSAGAGLRVNVFGFVIFEIDRVRAFQRHKWLWQFSFVPGF